MTHFHNVRWVNCIFQSEAKIAPDIFRLSQRTLKLLNLIDLNGNGRRSWIRWDIFIEATINAVAAVYIGCRSSLVNSVAERLFVDNNYRMHTANNRCPYWPHLTNLPCAPCNSTNSSRRPHEKWCGASMLHFRSKDQRISDDYKRLWGKLKLN